MPANLRDRLKRIQHLQKNEEQRTHSINNTTTLEGWDSAGFMTLRREIVCAGEIIVPAEMPEAACIVMPGIQSGTQYEDLLFFDLETSGLSGGAGTVAFLAAFGRLRRINSTQDRLICQLHITQYLLLDYPGENDFVSAMLAEIRGSTDRAYTIVSYNGKSFDAQILKTRCLMNGIIPPSYNHADLLHPGRRMWKHILPDCSQGTIESSILGIDRSGDIPGAMAPDIWFSFLKNNETGQLLEICEHNRRDIVGLAAIFSVMAGIAHNPIAIHSDSANSINYDIESLALYWINAARFKNKNLREKGIKILHYAAELGLPRAMLQYSLNLFKEKKHDDARKYLLKLISDNNKHYGHTIVLYIAALRALAIDSEHRLNDITEALSFAQQGLNILPPGSARRTDFEYRLKRLNLKREVHAKAQSR